MFRWLVASARRLEMLGDPMVITAAKWQDWLHPRGKDGRFIQVSAFANIFADPNDSLTDRSAPRRRAKITQLRPEGAFVTYYGPDGKTLPPDPEAGYPDMVPVEQLSTKVSSAPQAIARLKPELSASEEFFDSYQAPMTRKDYDKAIAELSAAAQQTDPDATAVVSGGQGPVSDEEFREHLAFLDKYQQFAMTPVSTGTGEDPYNRGLAYDKAFKDSHGLWSEEWQQIFDGMVDDALEELTEGGTKPKDRRGIMLGGLPGAGKSSVLAQLTADRTFRSEEWITTNPDYFKERMIEKGLYPEIAGFAPAETAGFIHAASSEMNFMLENALSVEGYNLIFDITMSGRRGPAGSQLNHEQVLDRLTSLDYSVDGLFVGVDPTTSRTRVQARHREGLDKLRTGQATTWDGKPNPNDPEIHTGGRAVPDAVIAINEIAADDSSAAGHKSYNSKNFDDVKDSFARWAFYSNSGAKPVFEAGTANDAKDRANMPGFYEMASTAEAANPVAPAGTPEGAFAT